MNPQTSDALSQRRNDGAVGRGGPAALRALRLHHWVKNLLIFVPVLTSHHVGQWPVVAMAAAAFAAFSLFASAVYIVNDLLDVESDRLHPAKRHRPIASGALPPRWAVAMALCLATAGMALALLVVNAEFAGLLALYGVLTTVYSLWLKQRPIVDVVLLGALYAYRILAGGVATGIEVTPWLLAFSLFFFQSLALLKRHVELERLPGGQAPAGRGYRPQDRQVLAIAGVVSGYLAVLVLALYIEGGQFAQRLYAHRERLWLLCPLFLYWVTRLWLLAWRGDIREEDPIVFAFKDRASYAFGTVVVLILVAASLP